VIEGLKTIEAVRHIFPSNANFVLFRMDHSYGVYKAVADLGVCSLLSPFFVKSLDCLFHTHKNRLSRGIVAPK